MADRVVMERLVRGRAPGRDFDVQFWQALGPSRILEAAWDLLSIFNAAGVRYLIVGGYAVMIHTEPLSTKDLDIWVDRSESNAQALFQALVRFGAPLKGLQPADFIQPDGNAG